MARTFVRGSLPVVITDKDGYTLDSTTPVPVNPAESGAANHAEGQVSVTNSATPIVAANSTRRAVLIKNTHASATVYIGGAAVSSSTGHALYAGEALVVPTVGAVYGIYASVTGTCTYMDIYD